MKNDRSPATVLKTKHLRLKRRLMAQNDTIKFKKGRRCIKISKKYGITMDELRELNDLSRNHPLRTGQKLLILQDGETDSN